jgi:protein ImuB
MERSEGEKAQAENVQPASAIDGLRRGEGSTPKDREQASNSESLREQGVQRSTVKRSAQEILAILRKWGIHTLGQLAALDKEQLGARLGPEAVRMWERANGQFNRVLKLVRPPESFAETFEFENEIETAEPLLFMLRRFLEQLAIRLGAIYLVAKELALQITFTDKKIYERIFKIPQPTNDADLLFRMLHTHLENFKSEHAIIAVSLEAHPTKPVREQFGFFETTLRNPHQLSETLARLTALLGADRVGTPVLEETHRPDAFRLEPFSWAVVSAVPSGETPHALRTAHATAVLRRFRPGVSASVLLNENTPAHVRSAEIWGKIIEPRGPYLISGNWWDEKSWARAEWDLEIENGELVRVHESDPPSQSYGVAGRTWKVDGIYD